MGVVRDVTIDQLTQAVTGISTSGMSDTTGQAINTTLGTLGKDTSLQDIVTAINTLGGTISPSATNVSFDNTGTDLTSSNVENAIKEVNNKKVEGAYKMTIGTINSTQTLTINSTIAFVFMFGTVAQIGIFGCRNNSIREIVPAGASLSYTASGTTYTFAQSDANVATRYLAIYI